MTNSLGHPVVAQPAVTVLMSVHNGERYLAAAIDSVLTQTFENFEFVIVDDASTDATRSILDAYTDPRIRRLANDSNIGLTKSLNRGLALARAPLVARQDADDVSLPRRLALQVVFMAAHPEIVLVGSRVRVIDESGRRRVGHIDVRAESAVGVRWQLLFSNPFAHSAVMFRLNAVRDALGGYDERFEFNQDFELWSRVIGHFEAANLPDVLVEYRAHADSIAGRRGAAFLASRRANLERNVTVQRANVYALTASESLADSWPPLWTSTHVTWITGEPHSPERAMELMEQLWTQFRARFPTAEGHQDVRRVSASACVHLAHFLLPRAPACALGALVRAIRWDSTVAFRSLPFVISALLKGRTQATMLRAWRWMVPWRED